MVIVMITGDFLGMSLTTDNVRPSGTPNAWRVGNLTIAGAFMGVSELAFCTAVFAVGRFRLGLGIDALRTLAFLLIVFGNQATMYANRARQGLLSIHPSVWVVLSSAADVLIASTMASRGIAMASLPLATIGATLVAAVIFALTVDIAKVPIFHRLGIV
jgi:H+-transporting ATPase